MLVLSRLFKRCIKSCKFIYAVNLQGFLNSKTGILSKTHSEQRHLPNDSRIGSSVLLSSGSVGSTGSTPPLTKSVIMVDGW